MSDKHSLYFIALLPPYDKLKSIQNIKEYVASTYHCKHALKSPPHITIVPPFQYPIEKEKFLYNKIEELNKHLSKTIINIHIDGYAIFLPKVIFINVLMSPELVKLYNQVNDFVKTELKIYKDLPPRPFHPHITIAFKDIKKTLVQDILKDLQEKFPIQDSFSVNKITLLKHNGKYWEIAT